MQRRYSPGAAQRRVRTPHGFFEPGGAVVDGQQQRPNGRHQQHQHCSNSCNDYHQCDDDGRRHFAFREPSASARHNQDCSHHHHGSRSRSRSLQREVHRDDGDNIKTDRDRRHPYRRRGRSSSRSGRAAAATVPPPPPTEEEEPIEKFYRRIESRFARGADPVPLYRGLLFESVQAGDALRRANRQLRAELGQARQRERAFGTYVEALERVVERLAGERLDGSGSEGGGGGSTTCATTVGSAAVSRAVDALFTANPFLDQTNRKEHEDPHRRPATAPARDHGPRRHGQQPQQPQQRRYSRSRERDVHGYEDEEADGEEDSRHGGGGGDDSFYSQGESPFARERKRSRRTSRNAAAIAIAAASAATGEHEGQKPDSGFVDELLVLMRSRQSLTSSSNVGVDGGDAGTPTLAPTTPTPAHVHHDSDDEQRQQPRRPDTPGREGHTAGGGNVLQLRGRYEPPLSMADLFGDFGPVAAVATTSLPLPPQPSVDVGGALGAAIPSRHRNVSVDVDVAYFDTHDGGCDEEEGEDTYRDTDRLGGESELAAHSGARFALPQQEQPRHRRLEGEFEGSDFDEAEEDGEDGDSGDSGRDEDAEFSRDFDEWKQRLEEMLEQENSRGEGDSVNVDVVIE